MGLADSVSDLVVPANFLRAIRESGYVSLSTSLAELIDNSLQASATEVAITIAKGEGLPVIQVLDNGVGMTEAELEMCLRFGGSSRFGERSSFGRFGMGLPAASLSQARRVEVAAWQSQDEMLGVSLDIDAIMQGNAALLQAKRMGTAPSTSGCKVTWRSCDRIEYRRLGWLERALRRDLGRMYRRFVAGGLTLTLNEVPIEAEDPLMLTRQVEGATARLAFDPLEYELQLPDGGTSSVRVRFAALPVREWHRLDNVTKRRLGIVGGGGVSVLRAGREIAQGWHLMGDKRKENYDDWWRCEIEFEPELDEHFGITINKQGIRPSAELRDALESEMASIARLLNARVRQAFEDVKFEQAAERSCQIAEAADRDLPPVRAGKRQRRPLSYRISTGQLPATQLFKSSIRSGTLEVQLNVDHPAFAALYEPLMAMPEASGTALRTTLELLLLSLARAAMVTSEQPDELLATLGAIYGRMLQRT
jgi:hypothetical protein